MNESISNAMLFNLVITFVIILIALFIGSMSYSKASKVNNRIVEAIEKQAEATGTEGFNSSSNSNNTQNNEIDAEEDFTIEEDEQSTEDEETDDTANINKDENYEEYAEEEENEEETEEDSYDFTEDSEQNIEEESSTESLTDLNTNQYDNLYQQAQTEILDWLDYGDGTNQSGIGYRKDSNKSCPATYNNKSNENKKIKLVNQNQNVSDGNSQRRNDYDYCVYRVKDCDQNTCYVYYHVITYMYLDIPIIDQLLKLPVNGETMSFVERTT